MRADFSLPAVSLDDAITDVQQQVNQLQEQIEQMGKEQAVEKLA